LSEKQPVEIMLNFIIIYRDSGTAQNWRKETVIPLKKRKINGCDTDKRNPEKNRPRTQFPGLSPLGVLSKSHVDLPQSATLKRLPP
jgi:hypothetical protein